jgi:hypothetical protein
MHRVRRQKDIAAFPEALDLIPENIRELVENVDVLSGVDPVFAGLHKYVNASYGRSYADTPHVAFEFHQMHMPAYKRAITMVLPHNVGIRTIVHELGHVLDGRLNFEHDSVVPVSWYAKTNQREAFAESFSAWVLPLGNGYGNAKDRLYETDKKTVELFERLAGN